MKLVRLQVMWRHFNDTYFGGQLHEIPIKITKGHKYYGYFDDGKGKNGNSRLLPKIIISGHRNTNEAEYRDTLLHEMIHQYLWETGQDADLSHGGLFQEMATKLGVKQEHEYTH